MAETTIRVVIDTSDLDEAIVKAKILNDELEKAKSLINDLTGCRCNEVKPVELISAELNPHIVNDAEIERIATKLLEIMENAEKASTKKLVEEVKRGLENECLR